ncbi:MAG: cytochrome c oxidase subunit 3 [Planctomycetes bacterium]|nr:cytochrome c oxidase subunit 3 [Planctomycetota bacterium]
MTDTPKDNTGAKLGMWLFLFTELLLFGGLFLLYAVYRSEYSEDFHFAAGGLDIALGTLNTVILLTSSLFMAVSVAGVQKGDRKIALMSLSLTIALGIFFIANKYFEWSAKIRHGIYPGSEHLSGLPAGENIFYGLYYVMTGLHVFHVFAGVILLVVMMIMLKKNVIHAGDSARFENAGLYWHLVDIIWLFLFPLLYLIT